jgi:hypothetical protein
VTPYPTDHDPEAVVRGFLAAVLARDEPRLFAHLRPDVWFRALLVRDVVEHHDAVSTTAVFRGWFVEAPDVEVLEVATAPALSRVHLRYRVRLRPAWAPDVWHVIEQSGYARVRDGAIARLDLTCTGFVPEPALVAAAAAR